MKRSNRGSNVRVGPLLRQFLEGHPAFSANPIGDWRELVGEQVARYTVPKSLKNKVLVILAHDSVWKHHLEQCKETLKDKINGKAGPIVEEIVIKVSEMPESSPVLNPAHKDLEKMKSARYAVRKKKRTPSRKLTQEEQSLLKGLPDPELREIGAKLLKRIPLDENDPE